VDFVIPPTGTLKEVAQIGVFTRSDNFSSPVGLSVPFMGLTRFPRDSKRAPKEVERVHGIRLWVGEESLRGTSLQFDYRGTPHQIRLPDYVRE